MLADHISESKMGHYLDKTCMNLRNFLPILPPALHIYTSERPTTKYDRNLRLFASWVWLITLFSECIFHLIRWRTASTLVMLFQLLRTRSCVKQTPPLPQKGQCIAVNSKINEHSIIKTRLTWNSMSLGTCTRFIAPWSHAPQKTNCLILIFKEQNHLLYWNSPFIT